MNQDNEWEERATESQMARLYYLYLTKPQKMLNYASKLGVTDIGEISKDKAQYILDTYFGYRCENYKKSLPKVPVGWERPWSKAKASQPLRKGKHH